MKKHHSKRRWLDEHFSDVYVKNAQKEGYRSRAAYKLLEINERDRLIRPGMTIIDLGAAPGGWSQVLVKLMKGRGRIIALDILPMEAMDEVEFIQGDFSDDEVLVSLTGLLGDNKVDLVISDMAPNISGVDAVDIPRSIGFAEMVLDLALKVLNPGSDLLVKVFQGVGFEEYVKELRAHFDKVLIRKPKASRPRSREVYLLARGFSSRTSTENQ